MLACSEQTGLIVIDLQPSFLAAIHDSERVMRRAEFLVRVANLLAIPVFVTEQYPDRMGATHEALLRHLGAATIEGKMVFSALGAPSLASWLEGKTQIVLCGIETMICVNQTAQQLWELGHEVMIAADAVGGRSIQMHELGLSRLSLAGCEFAHSEAIVYEWMKTAEHPQFREVLKLVKEYA
ncbi:MAG: isochorismatase family protein [Fimbriimonadaceae bacterium]